MLAHIRHNYTDYDTIIRTLGYSQSRLLVQEKCMEKLREWGGDEEAGLEDVQTLREVICLEDSDVEIIDLTGEASDLEDWNGDGGTSPENVTQQNVSWESVGTPRQDRDAPRASCTSSPGALPAIGSFQEGRTHATQETSPSEVDDGSNNPVIEEPRSLSGGGRVRYNAADILSEEEAGRQSGFQSGCPPRAWRAANEYVGWEERSRLPYHDNRYEIRPADRDSRRESLDDAWPSYAMEVEAEDRFENRVGKEPRQSVRRERDARYDFAQMPNYSRNSELSPIYRWV